METRTIEKWSDYVLLLDEQNVYSFAKAQERLGSCHRKGVTKYLQEQEKTPMSTFYDWDGEYAVGGDWEDVGSPVIIGYIDVWVNDDGYMLLAE